MLNTSIPETERAWAAGFFDGEGSAYVNTQKYKRPYGKGEYVYKKAKLAVAQVANGKEILERFNAAVGNLGRIIENKNYGSKYGEGKRCWQWHTNGLEAYQTVMGVLWPYLGSIKKSQIKDSLRTEVNDFKSRPFRGRGAGARKLLNDLQVSGVY